MLIGMLWFDNSLDALPVKIERAVGYYKKKFGRAPDLCLVHPSMLGDQRELRIPGMAVRPYRSVVPSHMWIGIQETEIGKVEAINETR